MELQVAHDVINTESSDQHPTRLDCQIQTQEGYVIVHATAVSGM